MSCFFIPEYLLAQLAEARVVEAQIVADTMDEDRDFREQRVRPDLQRPAANTEHAWLVHDADHGTRLPGTLRREPGDAEAGDPAIDESAAHIEAMLAMLRQAFGRDSYDAQGATAVVTVHYGRDYDNAFWNGQQLVFGDGDGRVFDRFTKPIDVLGHEFGHAVIERTCGLIYHGQSGALNESLADVFGTCLLQHVQGQQVTDASWLIGEGIFLPGIKARALRDLANPGTAYDDPSLGQDPQVGHLSGYVETSQDNGGVHLNSGIPNRAFHLAATAIGGTLVEGAGRIWYDAITSPTVGPDADFATFAAATIAVAGEHADAVRKAWAQVGVQVGVSETSTADASAPAQARPDQRVAVVRSGGFAGRQVQGEVDLSSPDPRADRCRALVDGLPSPLDLPRHAGRNTWPDSYTYTFQLCGAAPVQVSEQHLDDRLRELAQLVLSVES